MSTTEQKTATPKRTQHGYIYICGKREHSYSFRLGSAFNAEQKTDEFFGFIYQFKCQCNNVKLAEEKIWEQLVVYDREGTPEDFKITYHGTQKIQALVTEMCKKANSAAGRLTFQQINVHTATVDELMEVPSITKKVAERIFAMHGVEQVRKIPDVTEEMIHHLEFYTNISTPKPDPVITLGGGWKLRDPVGWAGAPQLSDRDKKAADDTHVNMIVAEVKKAAKDKEAAEDKKTAEDKKAAQDEYDRFFEAKKAAKDKEATVVSYRDFYNDFHRFANAVRKDMENIFYTVPISTSFLIDKKIPDLFIADFDTFALKTKQNIDAAKTLITKFNNRFDEVTPPVLTAPSETTTSSLVTAWDGSDSDDNGADSDDD